MLHLGLATPRQESLRLTPFPSARRGGFNKRFYSQDVDKSTSPATIRQQMQNKPRPLIKGGDRGEGMSI